MYPFLKEILKLGITDYLLQVDHTPYHPISDSNNNISRSEPIEIHFKGNKQGQTTYNKQKTCTFISERKNDRNKITWFFFTIFMRIVYVSKIFISFTFACIRV